MSNFEKPKTEYVSNRDYVERLLNFSLQKDIHGNEEVCSCCKGTGLVIQEYPYGLSNDPDRHSGNLFPYKHQSITFCPHCYNGVAHRCELCGEIMRKGLLRHDCKEQQMLNREKEIEEERKRFEKARKLSIEEYTKQFPNNYIFCDDEFFSEVGDLLDRMHGEYFENIPKYCYGTERIPILLDAYTILSHAEEEAECEDFSFGIAARKELEEFVETWNKKYGSYYFTPDYSIAIIIPEELRKEDE